MEENIILKYQDVLEKIENQNNHLLVANGFNRGLGINTGYPAIFERMIQNNRGIYQDALAMVKECGYDLELFIGKLEQDIAPENKFLKKYVRNKVKFDFMQSTHEIVKSELKNIYAEKNEGVYILLKNFSNYFTLNYDSFLYLLLLKYKTQNSIDKNAIAIEPTIKFIENDLNETHNNIYKEIKEARKNGELEINFGDGKKYLKKQFNMLKQKHFSMEVKEFSRVNNNGWKSNDIERVIKLIFEEEEKNRLLKHVDDGSRQLNMFGENTEYIYDINCKTQNIFFLHGAFQIYQDGHKIKRITQQTDKALYDRLEEILNNDEKDLVCVFQNDNKIDKIKENEYLTNCLNKLGQLTGNMVIIGSSLSENDNHIFEQINNSGIDILYISTLIDERDKNLKLAQEYFPSKRIFLFDALSISYELPDELEKKQKDLEKYQKEF